MSGLADTLDECEEGSIGSRTMGEGEVKAKSDAAPVLDAELSPNSIVPDRSNAG